MTKKEITIDYFKKSEFFETIKSSGYWSDLRHKWDVNYSSILTELIHQAGRWCEYYASDLFISWETVMQYLYNPEIENKSFLFGFRACGVDHDSFIFSRFSDDEYTEVYRSIYRLDIKKTDEGYGEEVKMMLYRVR